MEAWLSPDGTTWEQVSSIPAMDGAHVTDVVELSDGRHIAVGWKTGGEPTAWTSDDRGRTWAGGPMADIPMGSNVKLVVAGSHGAVALGTAPRAIGEAGEAVRGGNRLWWSADGSAWSAVPMLEDVFGAIDIYDVAATPTGFVAVGGRYPDEPAPAGDPLRGARAAAWRSADGVTWDAAETEDGPPIIKVFAGSQGMLGVGYGEEITGTMAWESEDGNAWRRQLATLETGNTYPAVWDGRIFMLRSITANGEPLLQLSESLNGVNWLTAGLGRAEQVGGIGVTAPGVPGLIQVGGGDGDAKVWLIRWPDR
jgi:hypothetical protein